MKIRIMITKTAEQATSAQIVASIDDLLEDILLRLPIRSLIRFKCVSKHWLSLISNPQFAVLHKGRNLNLKPALGLFLPCTGLHSSNPTKYEYINFDTHNPISPPFSVLKFARYLSASSVRILQSCNGLLLCSSFRVQCPRLNYHVFNPTTKQLTTIPKPRRRTIHGLTLAFDPAKSAAYEVVCISTSDSVSCSYQIEIYSSEKAGPWRISGDPFTAKHDFKNGVYWNGAVHWLAHWGRDSSLYFNLDQQRLGEIPPTPNNAETEADLTYFGESCGHLHLIQKYDRAGINFCIFEMRRDCSGWFFKYNVDLSAVTRAFPEMISDELGRWNADYYVLSYLCIIRCEKEEDAFLVIHIPGKAIRYNLVTETFEKLCDFKGAEEDVYLSFEGVVAYQYMESLCCV